MPEYVVSLVVAILSFAGTMLGAYLSHRKSSAIMSYKIEQLEKAVQKHNSLVERTYQLEKEVAIIKEGVNREN